MDKVEIQKLFERFKEEYDYSMLSSLWKKQSKIFKDFWSNKILNDNIELLIPKDTDPIIRLLDTKARGHQENDEVVARLGLLGGQDRIESLFKDLKNRKKISAVLTEIFQTTDGARLITLINKLRQENVKDLTGEDAVVLNAFLFINNPEKFTCVVSLKHRSKILEAFGLGLIEQYKSYGEKIIKSNADIINGFKEKYGIDTTPRALTEFLYSRTSGYRYTATTPIVKELWYKL